MAILSTPDYEGLEVVKVHKLYRTPRQKLSLRMKD